MHTSMYDDKETYVYAAEYVDGYIIGVDANNDIFTMKPATGTERSLGSWRWRASLNSTPAAMRQGII